MGNVGLFHQMFKIHFIFTGCFKTIDSVLPRCGSVCYSVSVND